MNVVETRVATVEFTKEEIYKLEQAKLVLTDLINFMVESHYGTATNNEGYLSIEFILSDIKTAAKILEWLPNSNKLI